MPHSSALALLCFSASMMLGSPRTAQLSEAEKAAIAMRYGSFEEAVRIYKSLCLQFPSDAALHLSLATALNSAGHYPEALRESESIQSSEKRNGKFWLLLGLTQAKLGNPTKAIEPLTRAVELEPDNNEARLEAASTLLELRRFSAAEEHFRILAARLPTSPKVWQGRALTEAGLSQQALEELKNAAPHSSYLYGLAALAASESGNTAKAIELYRRAVATPPEASWLRAELAALESGTSSTACHDASYACRFSSGEVQKLASEVANVRSPEALYWTTRIYAQLARDSMQTLSSLPPSAEQHQVMARLYAQNGQKSEAIAELREAAKLSPGDPLASGDLAEALWADRQYEESLTLLTGLVQSNPRRSDWQFEMGDALFNLGRPDESIEHLNEAVRLSPGLLPAQAKLGEALLRMGDAADAVPHLERAQSLDRDGSIHFQLATAYRKLGNTEAASKALLRQRVLANAATGNLRKGPATQ